MVSNGLHGGDKYLFIGTWMSHAVPPPISQGCAPLPSSTATAHFAYVSMLQIQGRTLGFGLFIHFPGLLKFFLYFVFSARVLIAWLVELYCLQHSRPIAANCKHVVWLIFRLFISIHRICTSGRMCFDIYEGNSANLTTQGIRTKYNLLFHLRFQDICTEYDPTQWIFWSLYSLR